MALLAKKLYMKNSAGTTQTANIYSTTGEVGTNYMCATVDGTNGYIPLVSTSDARATSGRVTKGGTTYAVCNVATPAYSYKYIGTAGSGTFTVPAGVTKLRVTCVGGGAGALCYYVSGNSDELNNAYNVHGGKSRWVGSGTGGNTTFGSVTANGATGNTVYANVGVSESCDSEGYCSSYRYVQYTNQTIGAGRVKGASYGYGYHAGTAGYSLTDVNGTSRGVAGGGGGGGGDHGNNTVKTLTGSAGYAAAKIVATTPGSKISYTVGAGGPAFMDTSAYNYEAGAAGAILVEWGKGIE